MSNILTILQNYLHLNNILDINISDYEIGHIKTVGKDANIRKNPIWLIKEDNGKEYLLMYCEKDTFCKLCIKSYQNILDFEKEKNKGKKLTWFNTTNGYICCNQKLFIHQIIMNCYGNGKGTKNISVDHIDRNPLNNIYDNLRIATYEEQQQNTKGILDGTKRARKINAKPLPHGITQDMMRKYVVYYHEFLNKEKTREREFFKIEKHQKLEKIWIGIKSNKISIIEKLNQANTIVQDVEKDIYPKKKEIILPKYVSLIISRQKPHLVFEKKIDIKRLNLKMVLPKDYDLQEQLEKLNEKIKEKYENESIL
jgi:hypothetical protein